MSLSLIPLLLVGDYVPDRARQALRAAYSAAAEERTPHLESAARILHRELALDCGDVRELVGLGDATCDRRQPRAPAR